MHTRIFFKNVKSNNSKVQDNVFILKTISEQVPYNFAIRLLYNIHKHVCVK